MVAETSKQIATENAYPNRTKARLATRDRIFEAALEEFRRTGVAAAQIENIVRKAHVARGTFYLHYPTKDHVLLELLRRKQQHMAEQLQHMKSSTSPRVYLRRVVDMMLEDIRKEHSNLWQELFAVIARHAPAMRSEASGLVEVLMAYFAAAQERAEMRCDITPFELTAIFLPALYGLLQMKLDGPDAERRRAAYQVVDIFVRGTSKTLPR